MSGNRYTVPVFPLGLDPKAADANVIEVWNKIDLVPPEARQELSNAAARLERPPVLFSALTGEGRGALLEAIETRLGRSDVSATLQLPASAGALRHWLHENTDVLAKDIGEDGATTYRVRLPKDRLGRLQAQLAAAGIEATASE